MIKKIVITFIFTFCIFGGTNASILEDINNGNIFNDNQTEENIGTNTSENISPFKDIETATAVKKSATEKAAAEKTAAEKTAAEKTAAEKIIATSKEDVNKAVENTSKSVENAQKSIDNAKTPEAKAIAEKSLTEAKAANESAIEAQNEINKDVIIEDIQKIKDTNIENAKEDLNNLIVGVHSLETFAAAEQKLKDAENKSLSEIVSETSSDSINKAKEAASKGSAAARDAECANSKKCLDKATFTIGIKETIGIGFETQGTTSETINYTLGTIIQKLMIALGVLSVLIMTVGAGYIIMYHGQDELLSKGKSIFMSGITALVVALSSYYIVSILRYILYN